MQPIVSEATEHVRTVLHPQIFNHSLRTHLLGLEAARRDAADIDSEALLLAALFHDAGTADIYDGPSRFEVEGADAAAEFLTARGWDAVSVDPIWEAIALHTSPGIAERRGPVPHYLRAGVAIEFGSRQLRAEYAVAIAAAEAQHPRSGLDEVLEGLVVAQALRQPQKAQRPSWAGDLVAARRHNERTLR
ncbi:HD domain-containing protein [Mycolicibacterium rutilum]|uniref:HD domain-containing protein n=1 Tax=Mycolicibacterium rutilum TaxID=370526 RepID=A0A1H6IP33_MYCRU|nr:HD domain-containing protein [Mycolicibacterium rutilum]SEH48336.1 HD domain-containing protein [Mycolicibacterium rutilum]